MLSLAPENNPIVEIIPRKGSTSRLKKSFPIKFPIAPPSPPPYLLMQFGKPWVEHSPVTKMSVRGQSKLHGKKLPSVFEIYAKKQQKPLLQWKVNSTISSLIMKTILHTTNFSLKVEWSSHSDYCQSNRYWSRRL